MCYIDKTNYTACANPNQHNGARQVDPLEFKATHPHYHYQPITPGYVPCSQVLQAHLSAKQCHDRTGPIQIRLTPSPPCPHCNGMRSEHGHEVTYRIGRIEQVTYHQDSASQQRHEVHWPFLPFCLLCRGGARVDLKSEGGRTIRDAGFGDAPRRPPGKEAYGRYGWGPDFR